MTEDEMIGWHHRLNAHEFEQTLGDGEGQGSLVCYSPRGCKESDTTEQPNNNKVKERRVCMLLTLFRDETNTPAIPDASTPRVPGISVFFCTGSLISSCQEYFKIWYRERCPGFSAFFVHSHWLPRFWLDASPL